MRASGIYGQIKRDHTREEELSHYGNSKLEKSVLHMPHNILAFVCLSLSQCYNCAPLVYIWTPMKNKRGKICRHVSQAPWYSHIYSPTNYISCVTFFLSLLQVCATFIGLASNYFECLAFEISHWNSIINPEVIGCTRTKSLSFHDCFRIIISWRVRHNPTTSSTHCITWYLLQFPLIIPFTVIFVRQCYYIVAQLQNNTYNVRFALDTL